MVGWEGLYDVSDQGQVWSRRRGGRFLRAKTHKNGYLQVNLSLNGTDCMREVHALVAEAFIGPRPPKQEVRHLNGVPGDCRSTNLAYGTSSENNLDIVRHGRHNNARKTHCLRGHPYDEENTGRHATGRFCRICARESWRAYRRRRSAALRSIASNEQAAVAASGQAPPT